MPGGAPANRGVHLLGGPLCLLSRRGKLVAKIEFTIYGKSTAEKSARGAAPGAGRPGSDLAKVARSLGLGFQMESKWNPTGIQMESNWNPNQDGRKRQKKNPLLSKGVLLSHSRTPPPRGWGTMCPSGPRTTKIAHPGGKVKGQSGSTRKNPGGAAAQRWGPAGHPAGHAPSPDPGGAGERGGGRGDAAAQQSTKAKGQPAPKQGSARLRSAATATRIRSAGSDRASQKRTKNERNEPFFQR